MRLVPEFILALGLSAATSICLQARTIPGDPEIRTGKLENGMTYYIRHYDNPKGKADFYIAHHVGSLQERDEQNGLAHILEHMAFNGTKHYPEKTILRFLGAEGVGFGVDINAYTAKEETVYRASRVPLVRESFVDSVLMVLHDWSGDITCDIEAIEAERGVIREEWRMRNDQKAKVFQMQNDVIYHGCHLKQRPVIGTLDVIEHADPKLLLDFYHTWYRPDLQAIIIVGDFDADKMEAKVKTMFSDLKNPVPEKPKSAIVIPALEGGVLYEDMPDTASHFSSLKFFLRQPYPAREMRSTREFFKDQYCRKIVTEALAARMDKAVEKPGNPVRRAVIVSYPESADFWVTLFTVLPAKDDNLSAALEFAASQMNSMLRYGISHQELEKARFAALRQEKLQRRITPESVETEHLVDTYVANFLYGYPTTFPSDLQTIQKEIMADITMQDVDAYIKKMFTESETICSFLYNPLKIKDVPSPAEKMAIIDAGFAKDEGPMFISFDSADTTVTAKPGSILKKKSAKGIDGTEVWTLSNGSRVWWTPIAGAKGPVAVGVQAVFGTGLDALDPSEIRAQRFACNFLQGGIGFGGASRKSVSSDTRFSDVPVMLRFSEDQAKVMSNSSAEMAETAFRLIHLQLVNPYFDEDAIGAEIKKNIRKETVELSNDDRFNDTFDSVYFAGNPIAMRADTNDIRKLTPALAKDVFGREFGDMSKCDFFVASTMSEEEIEAFVCKYLASIPTTRVATLSKGMPMRPSYKGHNTFVREYRTKIVAKARVSLSWLGKVRDNQSSQANLDAMDFIMSRRLLGAIREGEGGTYNVQFSSNMGEGGMTESVINFETTPGRVEELVNASKKVFEDFYTNGPTDEEVSSARARLKAQFGRYNDKKAHELLFRNATVLLRVTMGNTDAGYAEALDALSPASVRKIARKIAAGSTMDSIFVEK